MPTSTAPSNSESICSTQEILLCGPSSIVEGFVNEHPAKILVDTGSSMTIVNETFQRTNMPNIPLRPGKVNATSVTGDPVNFKGIFSASLKIGSNVAFHDFYVASGFQPDCILGTDFLTREGITLDMSRRTLKWNAESTTMKDDGQEVTWGISLVEKLEIPPRSELVAMLPIGPGCSTGLFEVNESLCQSSHVYAARSIVRPERGEIPVRLVNPGYNSVTLEPNAKIGTVTSMTDIATKTAESNNNPAIVEGLNVSSTNLTSQQQADLQRFLNKFSEVFATSDSDLGRTNVLEHSIDTQGHQPIYQRPYRIPETQRKVVDAHVKDMANRGIIRPSKSPWSSPIVLVGKKDGSTRFCVDYRKLNSVTRKDVYPLPRIDETLDTLGGAQYFTTLDLASGYWQLPLKEEDMHKTAFTTPGTSNSLWEFTVMPFGLCGAPASFQRLMEILLAGLTWEACLVYLDDIIVFSRTFEEHLGRLDSVLSRIRNGGLKLKVKKCTFCAPQVKYLGHVVSKDGLRPDESKVSAVSNFPIPQDLTQLRSFLGLIGYYRRFIQDFSMHAEPLFRLSKKNVPFIWGHDQEKAFSYMKKALTSAPILQFPDFNLPFYVQSDASDKGFGAVLGQIRNGNEVVVAYASKAISSSQINWSTIEKEAFAIVWSVKYFRHYLYGRSFTIYTDHNPLKWLFTLKSPEGRLARWTETLKAYDFKIEYRPGKSNANADALSRMPVINVISPPKFELANMVELQGKDQTLAQLIRYLRTGELPGNSSDDRRIFSKADQYVLQDGILYHLYSPTTPYRRQETRCQLVIPRNLIDEVLTSMHDDITAGHLGIAKTYDKIRQRYFWEGMYKDITHWIETCKDCASKKSPKRTATAPMQSIPVEGPFDRVCVDVLGPLPTSDLGNRYVVVFTDSLTKWPEAFAIRTAGADVIAQLFVEEIVSRHGAPRTLLSDRGKNFLSKRVQEICDLFLVKKINTTAYHPQTDGLTERFNHTLCSMLAMYVSKHQRDWDRFIPFALFAYRTAVQESTKETPFYLIYGRDPCLPLDVVLSAPISKYASVDDYKQEVIRRTQEARYVAQQSIERAQFNQATNYDASKKTKDSEFRVGDRVWLYTPQVAKGLSSKLAHLWNGPYRIIRKLSDVNVEIEENPRRKTIVHVNRCKHYHDRQPRPTDNMDPVDDKVKHDVT